MEFQQTLTVTLDSSAHQVLESLRAEGHFENDTIIIQESLHSLYRELHSRQQAERQPSFANSRMQVELNPDDFE